MSAFSLTPGTRTLATPVQRGSGDPSRSSQVKNSGRQIRKEEVKSLFADDMMLCVENPRDSRKTLLELINKFNTVARHKTGIQKLVEFLYSNHKIPEK